MLDRSSKYQPLGRYLSGQDVDELPLTFQEVERVLGFALPPSARAYPAWWSNNRGTNVAVKSWRDAGWRTSRVDVPRQRVTFVRESARADANQGAEDPPGVAEAAAEFVADDSIAITRSQLRGGAIRMLEDYCEEKGGDLSGAIVALLNDMALERRRRLI
ncbi:MAG TPA: hypothetical protein VFE13_09410, partial [Caulobacteraceae bacterium]|nr:hypothetical protein [Caulobacteraceae bacterium]